MMWVRTVVSWQLEAEGFVVGMAADGEQALSQIERHTPDVVALDLSLPRIGTLDVMARLRRTSTIPVIVTGGERGDRSRCGPRPDADD